MREVEVAEYDLGGVKVDVVRFIAVLEASLREVVKSLGEKDASIRAAIKADERAYVKARFGDEMVF